MVPSIDAHPSKRDERHSGTHNKGSLTTDTAIVNVVWRESANG